MTNRDDTLPPSGDDKSENSDQFLEETFDSSNVPAGDSEETRSNEASSGVGKKIGPYKLLHILGEGGMGTVWMAEQQKPVFRRVALKLIKIGVDNKQVIARFEAERQAVAMMNHENIAKILDAGTTETGQPYFVMELVQGISFNKYCDKNKLSIKERLELFIPVCKAVQHAHQKGIIHRDLKPSNVLVCLYDGIAIPKVIDFGLAKALEPTTHLTDKTMFTEFGQVVGTLQYMSPEQAEMNQQDIDTRTDIYSLGVMLYELLAGSTPIEQESLKDAAILNVLKKIREQESPRPSARLSSSSSEAVSGISSQRQIEPSKLKNILRGELDWIVMKSIEKDRERRYETANDFAEDLTRFLDGEAISAKPPSARYLFGKFVKRNRGLVATTVTIASLLMFGVTFLVSSTFAIQTYIEKQKRANAQINALTTAQASTLPVIFDSLKEFQATILPKLNQRLNAIEPRSVERQKERRRLQMAILKLETDSAKRNQLADDIVTDLLVADPGDFFVARDCLEFRKQELTDGLWRAAGDMSESSSSGRRFRAAVALALYDPGASRWDLIASEVAGYLTSLNEIEATKWLTALLPIRDKLKPALTAAYKDRQDEWDNTPERTVAILSSLFHDDVEFLVSLVPIASPQSIPYLTDRLVKMQSHAVEQLQSALEQKSFSGEPGTTVAVQESNLVTALIQLADQSQWERLASGTDMSVATELIERLGPNATPSETLARYIKQWESTDSNVLSGILLSLGQFRRNQILDVQKTDLQPILLSIFSEHSDSRVHSCARWLLQRWGFNAELTLREKQLRRAQPDPNMNWHVDLVGNTFALFGPVEGFEMGSTETMVKASGFDPTIFLDEHRHRKSIPRRFGMCIHEVTIGQFLEFEADIAQGYQQRLDKLDQVMAGLADSDDDESKQQRAKFSKERSRIRIMAKAIERQRKRRIDLDQRLPVGNVDFFTSLAFCRWLSGRENLECGLPSVEDLQQLYLNYPMSDILLTQAHIDRLGYRLPTATEWEYACRGRSETLFPFGTSASAAEKYAWTASNSDAVLHQVGQLKPGIAGLFDGLGNVSEWCLDWYREQLPESDKITATYVDFGPEFENQQSLSREYRGGSFDNSVSDVRPTRRFHRSPNQGYPNLGFRLARTYEPSTSHEKPTATTGPD